MMERDGSDEAEETGTTGELGELMIIKLRDECGRELKTLYSLLIQMEVNESSDLVKMEKE
jgi:hypothetical protein